MKRSGGIYNQGDTELHIIIDNILNLSPEKLPRNPYKKIYETSKKIYLEN